MHKKLALERLIDCLSKRNIPFIKYPKPQTHYPSLRFNSHKLPVHQNYFVHKSFFSDIKVNKC